MWKLPRKVLQSYRIVSAAPSISSCKSARLEIGSNVKIAIREPHVSFVLWSHQN